MEFRSYAERADSEDALLEGAVHVARLEYPGLVLAEIAHALDELAAPLVPLQLASQPLDAQADALAEHLHVRCGFRGNVANYHEPENSFINLVIDRRVGIPISLSLVYMEVARRAGVRARGLGFPGHFLVRLDDDFETRVIDPFFGGKRLDRHGLEDLLRRIAPGLAFSQEMLQPASTPQMIVRMLMNLRAIYAARAETGRLLAVLDHLIDLLPDAIEEVRERGLIYAKLGARDAALADLRRYLRELPQAGDGAEIRRLLERLEATTPRSN